MFSTKKTRYIANIVIQISLTTKESADFFNVSFYAHHPGQANLVALPYDQLNHFAVKTFSKAIYN